MNALGKRAVLMRLSIGLPGQSRKDDDMTESVKRDHGLGTDAGKWDKTLYPPEALAPIKTIDSEAGKYHDSVTLPFDKGIGILPAALVYEYGQKMMEFKGRREAAIQNHFIARYDEWVEWARQQHNGTFDPSLYPGAQAMRSKFYMRTEAIPVPDSAHFESSVKDLLGLDAESVNQRVEDATKEAQTELLRRMIEPVQHMVEVLNRQKPRIYDTMIDNIKAIADLVPKLNLTDDPQLNAFAVDLKALTSADADSLRGSKAVQDVRRAEAEAMLKRLSGYKIA